MSLLVPQKTNSLPKMIMTVSVLSLLSFACQKSTDSQTSETSSHGERNLAATTVPELLDLKILQWEYKDFDQLQKQFFYKSEEKYYWIPSLTITGIKQSSVNQNILETSRSVHRKSFEISDLLTRMLEGEDPATIQPQIDKTNADIAALFSSVGITDQNAPSLSDKYQKLAQMPIAHLELNISALFTEEAKQVIERYRQDFPLDYEKSKASTMTVKYNGNGSNQFYAASVSFDVASQTGVMTLDYLSAMDGNYGPQLLPYSAVYDALSLEDEILARNSEHMINGCFEIGEEWQKFSLCQNQ